MFLSFRFKRFLLGIFIFSNKTKQNKTKKTNRKKKKMQRKEGAYLLSSSRFVLTFGSHFWPPIFTLSFQAISPLHVLLLKNKKRKKKTKKKKTIERKKIAKKGRNLLTFKLSFCPLTFGLLFLPFHFKRFLLGIFFFSSRRKEKKNVEKGRSLPFFSCFCIWD
jgi:hypothetical protein